MKFWEVYFFPNSLKLARSVYPRYYINEQIQYSRVTLALKDLATGNFTGKTSYPAFRKRYELWERGTSKNICSQEMGS